MLRNPRKPSFTKYFWILFADHQGRWWGELQRTKNISVGNLRPSWLTLRQQFTKVNFPLILFKLIIVGNILLIFALLAAIYSVFKGRTDVRKCYFHFRQAITRHLKNKGNNAYRMVLFRLTFLFYLTKNFFTFTACEPFPVTDKGYLSHERKAMMNFTETLYYQPTHEDFYALWNSRSPQLQNFLSTFHKYCVNWFINFQKPDTWAHYSLKDTERREGKHVTWVMC